MTQDTQAAPARGTVRFGRRPRRGVLLGLSLPQLLATGTALLVVTVSMWSAQIGGLIVSSPVWALLLVAAFAPVGGKKAIEWVPVAVHWQLRKADGQHRFVARPERPKPAGQLALPGDAASLRVVESATTGAAYVHDPQAGTLTAVVEVASPAFALLSADTQERRVAAWGRVLAMLCQSGRISRVQVLERSVPESAAALVRWWEEEGMDDGSWASTTYADLITTAGPAASRHECYIAVSLNMRRAARAIRAAGGGVRGAAALLDGETRTITTALHAAELDVRGWLSTGQLGYLLRTAYDPAAAPRLHGRAVRGDGDANVEPGNAGPLVVEEEWSYLRTDSACHAVYWISEWPRSEALPTFLSPLVLLPGVRHSLSITAEPVTIDVALREIRRQKVEHHTDAATRQRLGQIEEESQRAEYADVLQRERELVAGHGDLRFTGYVSVSADDKSDLDAACAAVEQSATQAMCEVRRLSGQQAQAFAAAALPLGRGLR